ncbi:MAG: PDZ domain-containing protein [Bacteroides sp.]|nr:PDZ domain-containing protein [Bacteroides sp.]
MNTRFLRKYIWLLFALCLPLGFVACSERDEPVSQKTPLGKEEDKDKEEEKEEEEKAYQDEKAYANFFAYNAMNDVYLWKQDITSALSAWTIMGDPVEAVKKARYKNTAGEDIDKWTLMTDAYTEMVGGANGESSGTYGCNYKFYLKAENSDAVVAFVTFTYPGSPAAEAGLQRGDVVLEIDGKELNKSNYTDLYYASSLTIGVGKYKDGTYTNVEKTVSMQPRAMYENPVVMTKIFDCGGKKVAYLLYTSFTFESSLDLYEECKKFKQEGVSELILDLRYNGGGYVFTEEVLASMLAPEAEVKNQSVYETEIWNDDYMEYYKKKGTDLNTYFRTSFNQTYDKKEYKINTSDANIGLNKIYALVGTGSASASESILVGLLPYMDIEIIGEQTHGKYCTGIMWKGAEWYQDIVDNYTENKMDFAEKHPQFADWKKYIADWGLYVMINRYGDKDGNNPCMPNGLTPDVEAQDRFIEDYPLGDERENLLNIALTKAGKTDLNPRAVSRSVATLPVGKMIRTSNNPLDGKLIYTGDRIKPRLVDMP